MSDVDSRVRRPELGASVVARGIRTNYLEAGSGPPVVLVHGSGPGVSAYANWRLTMPALAERFRVLAPDMVGFGYTERPAGLRYDTETWTDHLVGFLDALGLARVNLVGNSFGGAIALRVAARHPDRVDRLVLMGSVGVSFPITPGLDAVWGYQPSLENMRRLLDIFAYSRELVTDELAEVRYRASIQPGFHESYSAMFPAPRQRWVDALATPEEEIAALPHETLLIHGRDDQVIPMEVSLRLLRLIGNARLHVFGRCGHWTQIERGEEFNRLLVDFLDRPSARR
ncbi:2-hydroxy-6-oxo-2,4-heptadienoate hydrolase [Carbonactinospora thermoautotrophica]|uniref:2-hydroxy-6-oxo-2,4-heptadienoate hydrolase n=2 Tax=Carbonactinospora thermoautotrophica TaxID=1469144 RepID=A0A132MIM3_9ACTN|nr:alpha/beta hydrolase [Carbonactinospora thermoautotrophica]KWW97605.1 2-hydroxy-6-oxo-2,4-heptadienoate hydrolase [Carbonactinospora thermoautotrophica]